MPSIMTTLALLALAYCLTLVFRLIRNLLAARKIGLPYVVVPVDQYSLFWLLAGTPLRPLLQRWLPKALYDRIVITTYGWEYSERMKTFHDRSSPISTTKSFVLVTCGKLELITCDPDVSYEILRRPRDFPQSDLVAQSMTQFGPSVITSDGDSWHRQRKIVASVINERISKAVFNESLRQTDGLIGQVFRRPTWDRKSADSNEIFDMLKKIAMHVLSGSGMGLSVGWDDIANETPRPGRKTNYLQAVRCLVDNLAGPAMLPPWFLAYYPSFLPGAATLHNLSYALKEFPIHTAEMLTEERQRLATCKEDEPRSNVMSQMLKASDGSEGSKGKALTEEEIFGNLFLFTSAGFETTANTMTYGLVLLARYQEWQDWVLAEIDEVLHANSTTEELEYNHVFPKLTRLLAVMFETLRFFPPLVHLPKQATLPQTITTASSGSFTLPAGTGCNINTVAVALDPDVYRNVNLAPGETAMETDELRFRPSRWINPPGSPQTHFQAPKGSFLPWSVGPRVCPGMKMAQVEYCAVMLALLREHRIEAVPLGSESKSDVEARLDALIRGSSPAPTLQIDGLYNPKEGGGLAMRLTRRKG